MAHILNIQRSSSWIKLSSAIAFLAIVIVLWFFLIDYILIWAVSTGNTNTVSKVLAFGADPNTYRATRSEAMVNAAYNGNVSVLQILLEHGGNPNGFVEGGYSVLSAAIERRHTNAVKLLLTKGANPCVGDGSGQTAIQLSDGYAPIIRLLQDKGCTK